MTETTETTGTETQIVGATYDQESDAWCVEIRVGEWIDYNVEDVIDVASGEESDAEALARQIAAERGLRCRDDEQE